MSFNPWEGNYFEDPYRVLNALREEEAVHWSEAFQGWIVTSYEHVKFCTLSPALSSKKLDFLFSRLSPEMRAFMKPVIDNLEHWAIMMDGDEHKEVRQVLNKAFSPKLNHKMEAYIRQTTKELLDKVDFDHEFDLVEGLSYPLPAMVIAKMLGVPNEKLEWFKSVSEDISKLFNLASKPDIDCAKRGLLAINELTEVLNEIVNDRRINPQDDFISEILRGGSLIDQKIISTLTLLLIAGHETTGNLISNGIYEFIKNPDQLKKLELNPELIDSAIEEVLRYEGPVQNLARIAVEDFELGDKLIKKGDKVVPFLNAANRDPQVFENPNEFNISRESNRHLAFGFGKHLCVGANLARLEAKIAYEYFFEKLAGRQVDARVAWVELVAFRQMEFLKLRLKS